MSSNPIPSELLRGLTQAAEKQWQALQNPAVPVIYVGHATCGRAAGSQETIDGFKDALAEKGIGS